MSKVAGSYASITLGVSQQVAQDRRPGQHEEQVNFISDPVRGLARRWGSTWQDEKLLGTFLAGALQDEQARMREYSFTIDGVDYCVLYRPFGTGSASDHFMYAYNKTTGKFLNVNIPSIDFLDRLVSGGVSAIANVGRFLYISGNSTTPTYQLIDNFGDVGRRKWMVGWVRGGMYKRRYTLRLTRADGTRVEVSHTTPPSTYPVGIDTSDIPITDPDYQNKITQRNMEYNKLVTEHITYAAQEIQPTMIASRIATLLIGQGVTAASVDSTVVVDDPNFVDIETFDEGDGLAFMAVGNEVSSPDKLSAIHAIGKIVRIRPRGASIKEAYYMQAYPKSGAGAGWAEVIWRETAGVEQRPVRMWAIGAIVGTTLYIGETPAHLQAISGVVHPPLVGNVVGDTNSAPLPNFFGKRITMFTVFQDRLMVGSEGVLTGSRPGDYINFFRQTVLDLRDNDPVEMFAHGAEGDVLRSSAMFDKDLVIFGDQKQYAVAGRTVLSPRSPNITVMSAHEDATQAHPVASGNFVFYGKQREGRTSVHQLQVGQLTESPESIEISNLLDTYLVGRPAQIVPLTAPNTVVFRTEQPSSDLYIYNYIDVRAGQERAFESWSRWSYNRALLGTLCGVSPHKGELLVFSIRQAGADVYLVCDKQSLSTELSTRPYMDSLRFFADIPLNSAHTKGASAAWSVALGKPHYAAYFGASWDKVVDFTSQIEAPMTALWMGAVQPAKVTPTNPYMRDSNGKALVDGRLTLTHVTLSVANTAGFQVSIKTRNGEKVWTDNIGRRTGDSDNRVGEQPVITGDFIVGIGSETRECSYTLCSQDWMPCTFTAINWTGQLFTRVRRAG